MPKYLHIVSAEQSFGEGELKWVKDEICRLFKCTELSVSEEKVFTVRSPFGPDDVERFAATLNKLRLHFRAGGRID
jgi:hypothetical protein